MLQVAGNYIVSRMRVAPSGNIIGPTMIFTWFLFTFQFFTVLPCLAKIDEAKVFKY